MYKVRYLSKVKKVLDNLSDADFKRIDRQIQAIREAPRVEDVRNWRKTSTLRRSRALLFAELEGGASALSTM